MSSPQTQHASGVIEHSDRFVREGYVPRAVLRKWEDHTAANSLGVQAEDLIEQGHLQRRQVASNYDMSTWQAQTIVSLDHIPRVLGQK